MDRQTATEAIKERLTDYVENITEHSKKGNRRAYICPICGSGTGRSKTGAFTIAPDGLSWKCFACDKGGDTLDLIGYIEDISDYSGKVKRAGELFNIETGTVTEYQNQAKSEQTTYTHDSIHTKENAQTNYISFYKDAHKHIKETDY
ncbi:CHC2 zinc finger domain-containing protein, partial [Klebsiella pneumoniae]